MPISHLTKQDLKPGNAVSCHELRDGLFDLIKAEYPDLEKNSYLSLDELNLYRRRYLTSLIAQEKGELAIFNLAISAITNQVSVEKDLQNRTWTKAENKTTFKQFATAKNLKLGGMLDAQWDTLINQLTDKYVYFLNNRHQLSEQLNLLTVLVGSKI